MTVTSALQSEFKKILSAPTRDEGDKYIDMGYEKITEFIDKLTEIKNADTREIGDAKINELINSEYSKYSDDLNYILNAAEREIGDKKIDEMIAEFIHLQKELIKIKNAATREEGDEIIKSNL